jgi:hypothetical protein
MDADGWLKFIEKKLHVVHCNNKEKVLFTCHQLKGPASDWWHTYMDAHKDSDKTNW